MIFSHGTAVLNLVEHEFDRSFYSHAVSEFGPPALIAMRGCWGALIPMSALFSALCLALAAFARSTKEGNITS